jgi:hypothetical protein
MGHVLEFLLETVIDDPSKNERARLLAIAREMDDGELRISDQDSGRSADPRQEG